MSLCLVRILSRQKTQDFQNLRSLSSSSLNFVTQRSEYKDKLSQLRKEWKIEHQNKLEKIKAEKAAEDKQTVLRRAIRLRQTRLDSAIRIEEARKAREEAMERYRHKLARNHILMADKELRQQRRYEVAVADLEKEKSAWITLENVDQIITNKLFDKQATTGLTTKHSNHWRYQAFSVDLKRMEHESRAAHEDPVGMRKKLLAEKKLIRRFETESYLNTVIGSGEERAKFPQLVKEYMDSVFTVENFEDDDDEESDFDGDEDDDDVFDPDHQTSLYYEQLMEDFDVSGRGSRGARSARDDDLDDEEDEIDPTYNPYADSLDEADREQELADAAKAADGRKKKGGAASSKGKPMKKGGKSATMRKGGKK